MVEIIFAVLNDAPIECIAVVKQSVNQIFELVTFDRVVVLHVEGKGCNLFSYPLIHSPIPSVIADLRFID